MILKTELFSKYTFEATNSYTILALSYALPFLDWNITELEIIDRETGKMLLQYHAIHSQSDVLDCIFQEKMGVENLPTSPTTTRIQQLILVVIF